MVQILQNFVHYLRGTLMCTAPQYDVTESLAQLVDLRTKSVQSVPFRNDIHDLISKGILDILIEYRHWESEQCMPMTWAFIRSSWVPQPITVHPKVQLSLSAQIEQSCHVLRDLNSDWSDSF